MLERKKKYKVAVVDDHSLVRKAIVQLINTFDDFQVIYDVSSGNELKEHIKENVLPDVVLMDINMPNGNGYETTSFLHKSYPLVKVLALSMHAEDPVIIKILKAGAKGYILKNSEPEILQIALTSIIKKDSYLPEAISGKIISGLQNFSENENPIILTDREKTFLTFLCSEKSYKEIAAEMYVSHRTIDEYKANLCEKLSVHTRVGLVMVAIKKNLVSF
jgi:DNA-binding NarL/FixJ family response regulator